MRDGVKISDWVLPSSVNIDITMESMLGIVPELEQREAALFCGYGWREYQELDWQERSLTVAHYRIHIMIENHVSDAANKKSAVIESDE
jgi:hypothetical protein